MKSLQQTYAINAPIEDVWNALVDSSTIDGWGGGPAEMSDEADTEFRLWDGSIWGKNTEVIPGEKLVQEWFAGEWDEPSIVTFTLESEGDDTVVTLEHTNIPDEEFESIENGWKEYYLGPLKEYVEA
jgi:activator of HSP90 ATPase